MENINIRSCYIGSCSQIDSEVKDFNIEDFVDKKKSRKMDKFSRYALGASIMAVKDSGIDFSKENPERCGVIVGSGIGGLPTIEAEHKVLMAKGARRISPFLIR